MAGQPTTRHELDLSAGGRRVRAVIADVGAAIAHLSVDGVDLAVGFEDFPAPFFCGTVLMPWPNRVRDGRWTHEGRILQLDITDPPHGAALHGLLSNTSYQLVERDEGSITLGARVFAQDGYPFDLDTRVRYQLAADGLRTTHLVRNVGTACAPVAMGAHPFLAIGDVPTDTLTLTVDASIHIDVDDRLIPTGSTPVDGTGWDLRGGRSIKELDLDDAWAGLRTTGGGSTHTLRAPDGRSVSLWADEHFGFLHVFITREFPRDNAFVTAVALEPMTAPANALNSGVGLRWMESGDTWSACWAIRYDDRGDSAP